MKVPWLFDNAVKLYVTFQNNNKYPAGKKMGRISCVVAALWFQGSLLCTHDLGLAEVEKWLSSVNSATALSFLIVQLRKFHHLCIVLSN